MTPAEVLAFFYCLSDSNSTVETQARRSMSAMVGCGTGLVPELKE
jgi:hypothetical protein